MKPRPDSSPDQLDLFQAQFEQLLNLNHRLCVLAHKIDWARFDVAFAECYCPDFGAPGKQIRLFVGLHYLKHAFDLSDEALSIGGWRTRTGSISAASARCSMRPRCTRRL